jgi:hypothetical protein
MAGFVIHNKSGLSFKLASKGAFLGSCSSSIDDLWDIPSHQPPARRANKRVPSAKAAPIHHHHQSF